MSLHGRFRASRLLAEKSLTDAARELGVSPSTVERAERGDKPIPPPWVEWAINHWRPEDEEVAHPLEHPTEPP